MTSLAADASALLAALWMPALFKVLAADIIIGAVILSGYLWHRKQERCNAELSERKWGGRHLHG
ncbi:hypothetical protein J8I29_01055 [Labrys sp. LIt4]|uniref:Uncharacterized protein n=1 Tax=Labrys okinawensis TaxID=346911 RepID=A0A2S9Q7M3_9HYPH|nr:MULTISPECIES: hypothetical protein [Labrys]MBP0577886.1 hypothetical protein [Labrys sp. LIt4]PRH85339.1 hypothetical protein C5L14_23135 [Labrys okinawensis]